MPLLEFHNTVASVIEKDGKFLLIEEIVAGDRVYNQPAGHIEDGESLSQAVIRETLEETAYHFSPRYVVGVYLWQHPNKKEAYLRIAFTGDAVKSTTQTQLDDGIVATHWLTADEIFALPPKALRSEMVTQCVRDYLDGKRFSLDFLHYIHPAR